MAKKINIDDIEDDERLLFADRKGGKDDDEEEKQEVPTTTTKTVVNDIVMTDDEKTPVSKEKENEKVLIDNNENTHSVKITQTTTELNEFTEVIHKKKSPSVPPPIPSASDQKGQSGYIDKNNEKSTWSQVGAKDTIREQKAIQEEYSNRFAPMYLPEEQYYDEDN